MRTFGFTTKRAEYHAQTYVRVSEASAGRKTFRGFTLIESLVAVTILTFAVIGPMVTASRVIVASQIARDQLVASYLAQEGVEYVRSVRDNEYLANRQTTPAETWQDFLDAVDQCDATSPQNATRACTLHPINGLSIGSCTVGGESCAQLYLSGGLYTTTQSSGTLTPFTRTIQVYAISATDERIVSTVTWSFHGTNNYSVSVSDHLTPWQ